SVQAGRGAHASGLRSPLSLRPRMGAFLLEIGMRTKISPVQCGSCGTIVERRSRQHRFCSPGCKERARVRRPRDRKLNAARAVLPSHPPKKMNQINGGQKANIIGQKHVIAAEVWGGREWTPMVSSDGVAIGVSRLRQRALVE